MLTDDQIRSNIAQSLRSAQMRVDTASRRANPIIGARGIQIAQVEAINSEARHVTVVANTDAVDLYRSVVVPSGADLTYIRQNRRVFVDHYRDLRYCAGSILDRGEGGGFTPIMRGGRQVGWEVTIGIKARGAGAEVWDDLTDPNMGGIGVSIGFESLDEGPPTDAERAMYAPNGEELDFVVRRWAWVELSFTQMPANVECREVGAAQIKTPARSLKRIVVSPDGATILDTP